MKKITSTINYSVPNWNFCNVDKFDFNGEPSNKTCRFCMKTKNGPSCLLYDEDLAIRGGLISKTTACCKATAGFQSTINTERDVPTVPPKELMSQAIDLYTKTLNDLLNQGYPRAIADKTAKKYVIGDK